MQGRLERTKCPEENEERELSALELGRRLLHVAESEIALDVAARDAEPDQPVHHDRDARVESVLHSSRGENNKREHSKKQTNRTTQ